MVIKEDVLGEHKENVRRNRMKRSSFWKYTTLVLLVLLVASLYLNGMPSLGDKVSDDAAVEKALAFVNEEMLAGFATAEVKSIEERSNLYVLDLRVLASNGIEQEFTSYLTKDGDLLFPTAVDLSEFDFEAVDEGDTEGSIDYSGDPVVGNPEAELSIIAFTDFACVECEEAYWATELVLSDYAEEVNIIFKNFPSSDEGQVAAQAGECAHVQGMFEEYYDVVFDNNEALTVEDLKQYAVDLEMDTEVFNSCLDSGEMLNAIVQDLTDGAALDVVIVPTYFIGEEILVAPASFNEFKEVIEPLLGSEEEVVDENVPEETG